MESLDSLIGREIKRKDKPTYKIIKFLSEGSFGRAYIAD
jgi:hypothetical protein